MRSACISLIALSLLLSTGCQKESSAIEREKEVKALFSEATTAESRGDTAAAITIYQTLLTKDTSVADAHLNLALLLQDVRKDYISAIHHYEAFLALQPSAEKASLVRAKLTTAKELLTTSLASEAIVKQEQQLAADRVALQTELATTQKQLIEAQKELATTKQTVQEQSQQIKQLKKIVESFKTVDTPSSTKTTEKIDLDSVKSTALPTTNGSDKSSTSLDAIRKDALHMIEDEDGGQKKTNEATRKQAENKPDESLIRATPTKGMKYLVRPGDTFSKIAREAYGSAMQWERIRDANRSTSNPNGRLRAGETILIP